MVSIQISEKTYRTLKGFVVDPFSDTPDTVLTRIMDIVHKAQDKWSVFESATAGDRRGSSRNDPRQLDPDEDLDHAEVVL